MGKSIIITESQYERIFLKEQEEVDPCLKTGATRLYYINSQVKGVFKVKVKVNPFDHIKEKYGCHIQYILKKENIEYSFIFLEKPNNMSISVKSNGGTFGLPNAPEDLQGGLTNLYMEGEYALTKLFVSSPSWIRLEEFEKDGKTEVITSTPTDLNSWGGLVEWLFSFEGSGNAADSIDEETKKLIDDLDIPLSGYANKSDLLLIAKIIYNNFNGKCNELQSFLQDFSNYNGSTLSKQISDMSYPFSSYNTYKEQLISFLTEGGKYCGNNKFVELDLNIKKMESNG